MTRWTRALWFFCALALAALPAAAETNFKFLLTGANEVPSVKTDHWGKCVGVLAEDESTFTLSCIHDLDGATAAHIHMGFADENGPVLLDLGDPASPLQAVWHPDAEQVVWLRAGGLYVNVHTAAKPGGMIRGQILPEEPVTDRHAGFALRPSDVVPPLTGGAEGACSADVDLMGTVLPGEHEATVHLRCAHTLAGATGGAVRQGAAGTNGDLVYDLGDTTSPIDVTFDADISQTADLLANDLYVVIDTDTAPDGALRGQIPGCLAGPDTLCLDGGRFRVEVDWDSPSGSGRGKAIRETDQSGMFWFFGPENLEMLVKVLPACPVNGHYWVFLAATTNVAYELTVTDTATDTSKTYSNALGDIAEPRLDSAAFATCP